MNLDENIEVLRSRSDLNIRIEGHTDNIGPEAYNLTLSERRAQVVYDYFRSNGITPERMQTAGYGFSRPIAENRTREGRALNRRSEINPLP